MGSAAPVTAQAAAHAAIHLLHCMQWELCNTCWILQPPWDMQAACLAHHDPDTNVDTWLAPACVLMCISERLLLMLSKPGSPERFGSWRQSRCRRPH